MKHALHALAAMMLLTLSQIAAAENSTRAGDFTIHHNAIPTAMLTPEIAKGYGIIRSKYRGLLNVSVIREVAGTTGEPVTAEVRASALNLIGKLHEIRMREILEGTAIYYIGDFPIVDGETLNFSLEVKPAGADRFTRARLSQDFYID
jgi:hypothetical protein